ncbi:Fumarate reductase flavoprotein subunit precursor [Bhargavaea cecembensis DSE10]|uniref:Fumarate reductase flavoprotein subunit n=1 Tax=Bhargavaea cecembensis DSE10 TaxID=1235279 RepID=M7NI84_9BACL|nr:FAD-dependent oxidoreductase [Bhargavaea cecembensis]EMR06972.1 Fumarate reductase flavoprotein subunit precursor [Bhargavaea cecembensis DSE10]
MAQRVDLIIVGAGMAGLSAAAEAADHGASVLVLEKEAECGGSSLLSGRYMAFAGTDLQEAAGFDDTPESLVADMLAVGEGKNETALVEAYGRHQLETYSWLKTKGVQFHAVQAVSGHSIPRGHQITPAQAIETLKLSAEASGKVRVLTEAPVRRLKKNSDGRVTTVVYEQDGTEFEAEATHGILLTAGGFSRSKQLLSDVAPQLDGAIRIGGKGNVGDGIRMAVEQGAWTRDYAYLKGTYGFHPTADGPRKSQALAFYKGAIIVNKEARRFVNESISYKLIGTEALRQENGETYQIWDQDVMDAGVEGDALYDFRKLLDLGLIESAPSLDALAARMNLPAGELKKTVADYNAAVRNDNDVFGRRTLTHHFGKPVVLDRAPFYAMRTTVAMLATYAGVAVNEQAQVLNPFGEPIDGLFSAGEMVGGFHGAGYMTGSSLGKAAIFGRIAVRTAIKSAVVS